MYVASDRRDHGQRRTQADRRARSRSALLEATARGISRYGYANLVLEQVANEAGYSRGALYHQFRDKDALVLCTIAWVNDHWLHEVGGPARRQGDPVGELTALAMGHAVFCRRDIAGVAMALRVEYGGRDHPVARELERVTGTVIERMRRLIVAGRRGGSIPAGPPARTVALALFGALEGAVIAAAGQAPHDELLAVRVVLGALGMRPPAELPAPT